MLFDNLPADLKSRLLAFKQFDWNSHFKKNWPVVLISILVGAGTHLFWDSFTHEHGTFVKMIPALQSTVNLFVIQAPLYKMLQHLSTLIGAVVIVFAIIKLPADRHVHTPLKKKYWMIFLTLVVMVMVLRFISGLDYRFYGHVIATAISAGLIALIVTPWLVRAKEM